MEKNFRPGVLPPQGALWEASEHDEQKALIGWWSLESRHFGIPETLLFAVPNGGRRDAVTGRKLREEGVRPGIPDLFLAFSSGGFHGLFIEMKQKKKGVLSKAQKAMLAELEKQGYAVVCAHGWQSACEAILAYMRGAKPRSL